MLGQSEVRGIDAVRRYFTKGLETYPDLKFDLQYVLAGDESLVLVYSNQNGAMAGEFMQLNEELKVEKMLAHYSK